MSDACFPLVAHQVCRDGAGGATPWFPWALLVVGTGALLSGFSAAVGSLPTGVASGGFSRRESTHRHFVSGGLSRPVAMENRGLRSGCFLAGGVLRSAGRYAASEFNGRPPRRRRKELRMRVAAITDSGHRCCCAPGVLGLPRGMHCCSAPARRIECLGVSGGVRLEAAPA